MLKGQLSRLSWPGNSWMPFTFQPGLQALQQPHKDPYSLQLPIHTQLGHHNIQHAIWTHSLFCCCFFFPRYLQCTAKANQSTKMTIEWATSHIKALKWHLNGTLATSKWHTLLVYSTATMGKCKQINISKQQYMSDVISIIHERSCAISLMPSLPF